MRTQGCLGGPPNPSYLSPLTRLLPSRVQARAAAQSASATPTANCSRLRGVLTAAKPHATCALLGPTGLRTCIHECAPARLSVCPQIDTEGTAVQPLALLRHLTMMVGDSSGNVYVYAMKSFPDAGSATEEAEKLNSVLLSCLSSQLPA
ncbi:unnamed protein product [Hydatigera taeniaeformis]|uniref:Kaptin n=1 Tax=Hydatigena taeniaeformis TaxID=6205 RepID=A0A0R3WZG5_HYDTA|nr:unnamed protein product [Hydatigera taeniaeformis]